MIDFEEELKNFKPALEIEEMESAMYDQNVMDVTDILTEMIRDIKGKN